MMDMLYALWPNILFCILLVFSGHWALLCCKHKPCHGSPSFRRKYFLSAQNYFHCGSRNTISNNNPKLDKNRVLPHFWAIHSAPTDFGRQGEPKVERSQGGEACAATARVPPPPRKWKRVVKNRNVCQGLALFQPAATQAVTEQLPEWEGSGGF